MIGAEVSQDQIQTRVLEHMFDLANVSAQRVNYSTVAAATNLPDARVEMALMSLERADLIRGVHNAVTGSHYVISEKGYRLVENRRLAPGHNDGFPVPAADRIVTLSDNQRDLISETTDDLINQLTQSNAIDGDEDLRERFIAQLRAAREIVRSHSVRAYLFYQLVVEAVSRLIQTYGKSALGVASAKLLEIYVEYLVKGN